MTHKTVADQDPFITSRTGVIPVRAITYIDLAEIDRLRIKIHHTAGIEEFTGFHAVEALLLVKPSALEGHRMKWARNAWAWHNIFGHLSLQFMASAAYCVRPVAPNLAKRMAKKGIYWHDITVPKADKLAL